MDTNTHDLGRLDLEELLELRALQEKMRDESGEPRDLGKLKLTELKRLERLYYKMKGEAYPWGEDPRWVQQAPDWYNNHEYKIIDGKFWDLNGEPYPEFQMKPPPGYVPVIASRDAAA